jgi:chromate transporter
MMDGLALGETTPGPLIMIVTFVGYVAGWNQVPLGPDSLMISATVAALIVTYFTFLPSFLFILAGGPFIESTHSKLKYTAPLSAITAAVVGVILNLAVFFAWHVFWPKGSGGGFDGVAALICLYALLLLFKYQSGIIPVIGLSALAGILVNV